MKAHKNSQLAWIQWPRLLWLKMEAPLLILTLALVSIPIVSLAAVLLLLPVARKRFNSFTIGLHVCEALIRMHFFQEPHGFWLRRKEKQSFGAGDERYA